MYVSIVGKLSGQHFTKVTGKLQKGYKLSGIFHVTAPYAYYFCLISTHSTSHHKMINNIHTQVSSMGMKLKPSKCRFLYFCSGRSKAISFNIGANEIVSIRYEEQKFLEQLMFFWTKSEEMDLDERLSNDSETKINRAYKANSFGFNCWDLLVRANDMFQANLRDKKKSAQVFILLLRLQNFWWKWNIGTTLFYKLTFTFPWPRLSGVQCKHPQYWL